MTNQISPLELARIASALDAMHMHRDADLVDGVQRRLAAGFDYGFGRAPRGEYWLRDGSAEYADGDVGDVNHEMLAQQQLLGDLGYDLSEDPQSMEDANYAFNDHVDGNVYGEGWPAFARDSQAEHGDDWAYQVNLEDYLRHKNVSGARPEAREHKQKWFDEQYKGFKDSRSHAIKNWGWQRLQGRDVELWDLSPRSIENLARGLEDAYTSENDGFVDEDEDGNSAMSGMTFNIEVRSLGKMLRDVPFSEIEDGSVAKRLGLGQVEEQANFYKRQPHPRYNNQGD